MQNPTPESLKSGNQTEFQWSDFLNRKEDLYAESKYQILIKWLRESNLVLSTGPKQNALIIGCGSGEFALLLADLGFQVLATDIDEATISLARTNILSLLDSRKMSSVEYKVASLSDLNEDRVFDLVVATDVIEHIEDDKQAIDKIRKLVKPSGNILITVPALQALFGIHDENLAHFRRYNQKSLLNLFGNDFEILNIRYFGFCFVPITYLVSRCLRRPYPLQKDSKTLVSKIARIILKFIFAMEKKITPPLGTSLLLQARPKQKPL